MTMPPERLHPFDLPIQRILVDLETRHPPWMKLVSQSNESAFARLSNEIEALADLVSPTTKEKLVRTRIIERLELQVRRIWSSASVVPIGSYAQELYTSSRYSHHTY
jgi:DNA polymerase sigma